MIDNHIKHGNDRRFDTTQSAGRAWWTSTTAPVRSWLGLADQPTATFGRTGSTSQPQEVMAILVLARDYADLRARLGEIIVGPDLDGSRSCR